MGPKPGWGKGGRRRIRTLVVILRQLRVFTTIIDRNTSLGDPQKKIRGEFLLRVPQRVFLLYRRPFIGRRGKFLCLMSKWFYTDNVSTFTLRNRSPNSVFVSVKSWVQIYGPRREVGPTPHSTSPPILTYTQQLSRRHCSLYCLH